MKSFIHLNQTSEAFRSTHGLDARLLARLKKERGECPWGAGSKLDEE